MTSHPGWIGSRACYWDAPALELTVVGSPGHERSGTYTKLAGTHNGLPMYENIVASAGHGGFLLRADRFNGWVVTVKGNTNDGSGYGVCVCVCAWFLFFC